MDCISAAPDALPPTAQSARDNAPDLVEWTATALSQAIHARQVSCVEVLEAYLAQIDRLNPIVKEILQNFLRCLVGVSRRWQSHGHEAKQP